jgi:hypothetical protein
VHRRLTALTAAILGALALDCKDEPGPLFEGSESLEIGPTTVEGDQTRAWMVTAELSLPREAGPSTFQSDLDMDILFSSDKASMDAAFVVRECGDGFVHTNLSFPREGDAGSTSDESFELSRFVADCTIGKACVRTMCVEASNHRNAPLELSVELSVTARSDAPADDDTIEVPIELTLEEIVP